MIIVKCLKLLKFINIISYATLKSAELVNTCSNVHSDAGYTINTFSKTKKR